MGKAADMLRPLSLLGLIVALTSGAAGVRATLTAVGAGTVLAYEPGVPAGPAAFYLEDMILVTDSGHEVLSSGLPYSAAGIAELMRQR